MDDQEFKTQLAAELKEVSSIYPVQPDKAFLIWAGERLFEIELDDSYQAATMGGKNDVGLDFGLIEDSASKILLGQGKYSEQINRDIIRSLAALPGLLEDSKELRKREANNAVLEFARDYRAALKRHYSVETFLVHLGELTPAIQAELGSIKNYDLRALKDSYESSHSVVFNQPPSYIDLTIEPGMFFKLDDRPGKARCYVARVPLIELHGLYRKHKEGLLDRNIRLHAGKRTAANSGMIRTLQDPSDSSNFFYYNNGLCLTCSRFDKPIEARGVVTIRLHDPQIVNGGQTYHTVGVTDEGDLKDAFVVCRIISPPPNDNGNFIEKVIRYNNTQTLVTSRDFHSNDDIQKSLFEKFSKFQPSWFYERKLGLWEALPDKERNPFRREAGRSKAHFRIIDSEHLAQCKLAWDGTPAIAKTKKNQIFEDGDGGLYRGVFGVDCDSDESIKEFLTAYKLNELIISKRRDWARRLAEAEAKGAAGEGEVRILEQDSFVAFANFFILAAIHEVMERYYPGVSTERVLNRNSFDKVYAVALADLKTNLAAAQAQANAVSKVFNMGNWFKADANYQRFVVPGLESFKALLPPEI